MQKFLKLSVGLSDNQTAMVSAGSLNFALCLQPVYAWQVFSEAATGSIGSHYGVAR